MTDYMRNLMLEKLAETNFKECSIGELEWCLSNYNLTDKMRADIEKSLSEKKEQGC